MVKRIIFLGTTGFPHGLAEVEKQTLIARSLVEEGCDVIFLCNKSFNYNPDFPYKGQFKGISYLYTSLSSRRYKSNLCNFLSWALGYLIEKIYLIFTHYDVVIINSRSYFELKRVSFIVHLRNKKLFLTLVEDAVSITKNKSKKLQKDVLDFTKKGWQRTDGIFPISNDLINELKQNAPNVRYLKIPVLVDLDDSLIVQTNDELFTDYFLFCGSTEYIDIIDFIIIGYESYHSDSNLILVINGPESSLEKIAIRVSRSNRKSQIIIKTKLTKEKLWYYYKHAKALLIPLQFNKRDKSRFPHKIGEYAISKGVIISSNWGEIPFYFEHLKSAYLLNTQKPEELCQAFEIIDNNIELCKKMSNQAYLVAVNEFDYKLFGKNILQFISE